ncbi:MAG: DUF3592 domain-containing protein [Pseudomonadota bacterium]
MEVIPDWIIFVVLLCFAAVPLAIGYFGIGVVRGALRARKHGVWVTGTVVDVKAIHNVGTHGPDQFSYQPIFEFAAPDGQVLRGAAGSYGNTNRYTVGDEREVLVDFDNPDIVLMSGWYRLAIGTVMVVFGLSIAAFLAFALFGGLRSN